MTENATLTQRPTSVGAMLLTQVEASSGREAFRYLKGSVGLADLDARSRTRRSCWPPG